VLFLRSPFCFPPSAFWSGLDAKMVESASKGAVLMYSKETLNASLLSTGTDPVLAGLLAGAGGGVCQVAVMGPCTFLVTSKVVSSGEPQSTLSRIQSTYAQKGVKGFYPGGTALAFRQATNWASRQGFTEAVRGQMKARLHPDALPQTVKLSKLEEVAAGTVGGVLACWNHPFEVARIEAQSRAAQGQSALSMVEVMQLVVKENGLKGLFTGLTPRVMLGIWQVRPRGFLVRRRCSVLMRCFAAPDVVHGHGRKDCEGRAGCQVKARRNSSYTLLFVGTHARVHTYSVRRIDTVWLLRLRLLSRHRNLLDRLITGTPVPALVLVLPRI
jgi:hypothetical protein